MCKSLLVFLFPKAFNLGTTRHQTRYRSNMYWNASAAPTSATNAHDTWDFKSARLESGTASNDWSLYEKTDDVAEAYLIQDQYDRKPGFNAIICKIIGRTAIAGRVTTIDKKEVFPR